MTERFYTHAPQNGYSIKRYTGFQTPVFRFDARLGQNWENDPDEKRRAELQNDTRQPLEVANWHSCAVWVDPGPKFISDHCLLTQCHDHDNDIYENIPAANLHGDELHLIRFGSIETPLATIPFTRGEWHYLLFRFVPSATVGSLKFWYDGVVKYDAAYLETFTAPGPYWKFGAYLRDEPMPNIVVNVAWFGTGLADLSDHAVNLPPIS
jgi:hypothetical protein